MNYYQKIKNEFKYGTTLHKLIYTNVIVFLIILFIKILSNFIPEVNIITDYLVLPSNLTTLLHRPWTLLTYMFLHFDFIHIFFNLLVIYSFGNLFLYFFSQRDLVAVYLLGGIVGGLLFILYFNLITPNVAILIGASASAMAIILAIATYAPNYSFHLTLIGEVKAKYLAIFLVIIDLISVPAFNSGGHIAHIGGALFGFVYGYFYRKGKNIAKPFNNFLDKLVNLVKNRPTFNVTFNDNPKRPESDQDYRDRKAKEQEELDKILKKIKLNGYNSLTENEKKQLFNASQKK